MLDATAIVVGIVIGSGIFVLPNVIARSVPSYSGIVAAWLISGLLSFFGALAYAELGAMIPATGGQYVFLREAWGPLFGFLCGWTYFFVVLSASMPARAQPQSGSGATEAATRPSVDDICRTLGQAAAGNDLPEEFFTRLIWQESRFDPAAVSPAGAQGIAQFMPQTAAMRGLTNAFEPLQALRESAGYLRELRTTFRGNLGLAEIHQRLERTRVNFEQDIRFLHEQAFLEVDLLQVAADAGAHLLDGLADRLALAVARDVRGGDAAARSRRGRKTAGPRNL
jgi:hypothetical protein